MMVFERTKKREKIVYISGLLLMVGWLVGLYFPSLSQNYTCIFRGLNLDFALTPRGLLTFGDWLNLSVGRFSPKSSLNLEVA